jgi:hypothetical protein
MSSIFPLKIKAFGKYKSLCLEKFESRRLTVYRAWKSLHCQWERKIREAIGNKLIEKLQLIDSA